MRDIHLPEPVAGWPPAPGWWIAGFAVIALTVITVTYLKRRWRKNAYKREALKLIKGLEQQRMSNANPTCLVNDLSELMRRICLTIFPRTEVAGLTGNAWLSFLDHHGNCTQFTNGVGSALINEKFQNPANQTNKPVNTAELISLCRQWVKTQK